MSNELNTNKWHHVQTTEAYIDYEKEIASFDDEGNSSVDMRMTFDLENNHAYIVMVQRNDIASPRDLEPDSIPVDWGAAKKMLAVDGVDIGPLIQVVLPNEEVAVPDDPFKLCFGGVASTPDWAIEDKNGRTICEFPPTTTRTAPVVRQRAHMMAVAPVLASTLRAALREIQKLSPSHPLIPKVVATLATAFAGEPGEAAAEVAAVSNKSAPAMPVLLKGDLPADAWQRGIKLGDRVYWMDPNGGECSGEYVVNMTPGSGVTCSDHVVGLVDPLDKDGYTESYPGELTWVDATSDPIPAKMITDDHVAMVEFDASKWFMNASDSAIIALAEQGWGGDDRADGVAESFDEGGHHPNPEIAAAFAYLKAAQKFKTVGFECYIAKDEAMAWIQSRRPALFEKINGDELAPAP
jgi:hypothetical protein